MNENPLNDPEAQAERWSQDDPLVMYLVVNRTLEMSIGKTAAQVGHGVGIVYEKYVCLVDNQTDTVSAIRDGSFSRISHFSEEEKLFANTFYEWSRTSFRKIVLSANAKQFEKIKNSLPCWVVVDAGFTEIPSGSETVLAFAPMRKSERPKLLAKLMTL